MIGAQVASQPGVCVAGAARAISPGLRLDKDEVRFASRLARCGNTFGLTILISHTLAVDRSIGRPAECARLIILESRGCGYARS